MSCATFTQTREAAPKTLLRFKYICLNSRTDRTERGGEAISSFRVKPTVATLNAVISLSIMISYMGAHLDINKIACDWQHKCQQNAIKTKL